MHGKIRARQQPTPTGRSVISSQILFLFSALGAVNGVMLAAYFFFSARRATWQQGLSNVFLGLLLLAISVRTGKSTIYYFYPDTALWFIQFGLSACLLIGPLTYLYVHFHLAERQQKPAARWWYLHLALPLGLIFIGVLFPYSQHPQIWRQLIGGINKYWLLCLLMAGWQLWRSRRLFLEGNEGSTRQTVLLLGVYLSSCLILIAYMSTHLTSYIVGALSFTFTVHITVMTFILLREEKAVLAEKKEKYQNRKLADDEAQQLLASLNQAMHEQQLFLNSNLSLAMLARKTGHSQILISQVLNDKLAQNFNHYVNEFRVAHARTLLVKEPRLTMEQVAERSGFNSSSTFFAAFKKICGKTPASYRVELSAGA